MPFQGAHIALTVCYLSVSGPWYERVFGGEKVFDQREGGNGLQLYSLPNGLLLGLRMHEGTMSGERFTHERVGLDHFGLHCADRTELEEWTEKLDGLSVSHSGIVESPLGHHVSFRDPDNIALEIFAPAPATD